MINIILMRKKNVLFLDLFSSAVQKANKTKRNYEQTRSDDCNQNQHSFMAWLIWKVKNKQTKRKLLPSGKEKTPIIPKLSRNILLGSKYNNPTWSSSLDTWPHSMSCLFNIFWYKQQVNCGADPQSLHNAHFCSTALCSESSAWGLDKKWKRSTER